MRLQYRLTTNLFKGSLTHNYFQAREIQGLVQLASAQVYFGRASAQFLDLVTVDVWDEKVSPCLCTKPLPVKHPITIQDGGIENVVFLLALRFKITLHCSYCTVTVLLDE